jgi:hypothetical protein
MNAMVTRVVHLNIQTPDMQNLINFEDLSIKDRVITSMRNW